MVELVQYETEDGACPFAEWFDGLDVRAALKVRTALARMELGNFGDVKPVGQGVSERRIDLARGFTSILRKRAASWSCFWVGGTKKRQQRYDLPPE